MRRRLRIPSRVNEEAGKYAYSNGTQAPINRFKSKLPQYDFLRTSIRNRKGKFNDQKEDLLPPIFSKRGRPNLGRNGMLQKAK